MKCHERLGGSRNSADRVASNNLIRSGRSARLQCIAAVAETRMTPVSAISIPVRRNKENDSLALLSKDREICNLTSQYSPEYVESRVMKTPADALMVLNRIGNITLRLGGFFASLQLDKLLERGDTPDIVKERAAQLREMLTALGPSFIKAGQVLANRPDIMRADYMNELTILQDDVPCFPDEVAFEIMRNELGRPLDEVFSSISEKPIAAASLGQVYRAVLRETGEEVAIKVQRPGVEPIILRDLFIFRSLASLFNSIARKRLGCDAELIVDEFGEKLLEELDYRQEARNIEDFYNNFQNDPTVKIPWVRRDLCGPKVLVMEWIDGIRCTDPEAIRASGLDIKQFIRCGVVSGLRQLLEMGLFHGDPHPGNLFALRDGRIAYVDFGNVAQLSQNNKVVLVDAVVHAVNEDYASMAQDFVRLGFLSPETDITPIVPALEKIWADSLGQRMSDFNFRTVTSKFNELVYQYPIRIPARYSLVIRSLLTQEGICMTLDPTFQFLEVAYPYVARRLLTDENPQLREKLIQVLFSDGKFQWKRLENLITLAREGSGSGSAKPSSSISDPVSSTPNLPMTFMVGNQAKESSATRTASGGLDLSDTVKDALKVLLVDEKLRNQMLMALTEDNKLHVAEVLSVLRLIQGDIQPRRLIQDLVQEAPKLGRQALLSWADKPWQKELPWKTALATMLIVVSNDGEIDWDGEMDFGMDE